VPYWHQVNGCFLPERGDVEGTPSTDKKFLPFTCFLLALFGELGSQDRQVKGGRRGFLEGHLHPASPVGRGRGFSRPPLEIWRAPWVFLT